MPGSDAPAHGVDDLDPVSLFNTGGGVLGFGDDLKVERHGIMRGADIKFL